MNLDTIPRYQAALRWEEAQRDGAFLDLTHTLCGVEVHSLTLRRLVTLIRIRSPFFVSGRNLAPADVCAFLWFLSPRYSPAGKADREKFLRLIARKRFASCVKAIDRFVDEAFLDAPARRGSGSGKSIVSFAASMVDLFAREYGWSESAILDLPIARLYQYLRCVESHHNPKAIFINRRSDKVRGAWLRRRNAVRKTKAKA